MKYVKHLTLKEWNRFKKPLLDSEGKYSIPGNEFNFKSYDNLDKRHEMLKGINTFCTDTNCSTTDTSKGNTICGNCEKHDKINSKYPPLKNSISLQTITGQELLLSKYIIILDNFEPKWTRRYHTLKKYVNQKNLNKGIKSFNKAVNAFSSGLETTSSKRKSKKDHDILFGKKKASIELWGKKKNVSIWGEKTKRRKKYIRKKREEHNVPIW